MAETEDRANDAQESEGTGLDAAAAETVTAEETPWNEADQESETAGDKALLAAQQERDEYRDALIRERADFENYKKRNASLAASSFENGVENVVNAVLPVLDNFERALAAECSDKQFASGMQMTMRQLQSVLQGLGVEEIDTQGEFDPTRHHAIAQTEESEIESNMVTETLQKGYTLKGRVIRPAMVKVNK